MGNDVKKVLLVYYSQTGQLAELVRNFAEPLQQGGVHVDCVNLEPQEPYPFPWSFWRFFNTFPETVHLKPAPILPPAIPADDYDAVVIAYTVWFLSPAQPITAFLQREETRRLLNGKPVVTLIGCRNMWLGAQEKMKSLLAQNGAKLIGNIVKIDACNSAASFITTPAWLLSGDKQYFRALPSAGIADRELLADGIGTTACIDQDGYLWVLPLYGVDQVPVDIGARRGRRHAEPIGVCLEDRRSGDVRQGTRIQAPVRLGVDEVQHLKVAKAKGGLPPHEHREVVVIEPAVTYIDARERAADEGGLTRGSKLYARKSVGDGIHAVRHGQLGLELADDVGHGGRGHVVHVTLVRKGELVRDDDPVHASPLECVQVPLGMLDGTFEGPPIVTEAWVSGERVKVKHRDYGFPGTKQFVNPHGRPPSSWAVCRALGLGRTSPEQTCAYPRSSCMSSLVAGYSLSNTAWYSRYLS